MCTERTLRVSWAPLLLRVACQTPGPAPQVESALERFISHKCKKGRSCDFPVTIVKVAAAATIECVRLCRAAPRSRDIRAHKAKVGLQELFTGVSRFSRPRLIAVQG